MGHVDALSCQTADPEVGRLLNAAKAAPEAEDDQYKVEWGLLYRKYGDRLLFVMPQAMRKSLLVTAHDLSGHPAMDRTMGNLLQDFWFPGMKRYVRQHLHMCFECLLAKNPRGKRSGLLYPIPVGRRPFEIVHMDHVGPFVTTMTGNRYILVLVDNFTKFVVLFAVKSTTAEALLTCVCQFVEAYGLPREFITDRGTCYTSKAFEDYCLDQGIQLVLASSRHRRANGQVERVHSVVMAALMTEGDKPDSWDLSLPAVQRYLNNSKSKVTSRTPFELLHGYRPRFRLGALRAVSKTADDWTMPSDLWQETREQMEKSKSKIKSAFDKHRHDNTSYSVGEVVVMKRCPTATGESTKLQDQYRGTLIVTEKLPGDVYRVVELNKNKKSRFATTAHVIQLKSWKLYDEGDELGINQEEEDEFKVNHDEGDELEINQEEDDEKRVNQEEDELKVNHDEEDDGIKANRNGRDKLEGEGEVEPKEGMIDRLGRPVRKKFPPCWAQDYV